MPTSLFIAGASVRAAAQSAVRAHCVVTAADLFGDRDLAAVAVVHPVRDYPEEIRMIGGRVPAMEWMYTGGLENYPDLVDEVSRRHLLLGNPGEVLRRARDPWELATALHQAGMPVASPCRELPNVTDDRWLIKPLCGSGGTRIRAFEPSPSPARRRGTAHPHRNGDTLTPSPPRQAPDGWYYQRWIRGKSLSAVYLAAGGRATLVCVTRQLVGCAWAGSRGFEYTGSIGPLTLPAPLRHTYERLGAVLAERWGLRGLFGVDSVVADNGVWTIEVNPRYPASVEVWERATGVSAVAWHRAACSGELPEGKALPPVRDMVGKAIIVAPRQIVMDATASEQLSQLVPSGRGPGLADLPRIGQAIPAGAPVFTAFAEGRDYRSTCRQLRLCAGRLRTALTRH